MFVTAPVERKNTSTVERMNISIRTSSARFKRKTLAFSKDVEMMKSSVVLLRVFF